MALIRYFFLDATSFMVDACILELGRRSLDINDPLRSPRKYKGSMTGTFLSAELSSQAQQEYWLMTEFTEHELDCPLCHTPFRVMSGAKCFFGQYGCRTRVSCLKT